MTGKRGPIVVKVSGRVLDDRTKRLDVCRSLAGLEGRGVIVHGGGAQIDALFGRLGEPIERVDGIRRTPESQIDLVAGVLAGTVNERLVAGLRSVGCRAAGLSLASAGVIDAEVNPAIGGRVGRVTGGDASLLRTLIDAGRLPVVSPIGCDGDGGLLNINADDAAAGVATAIDASLVVLLTDVPGVCDDNNHVMHSLDEDSARLLIDAGTVRNGMVAKLRAAFCVARAAGCPVRIASANDASRALQPHEAVGTLCMIGSEHTESEMAAPEGESSP